MKGSRLAIIGVLLLVVVGAVGVGGFVLGDIEAVKGMTIKHATPHQLAEAMKGDHFYSDYRKSAVLLTGKVTSVGRRDGVLVAGFETESSFGVSCDLGMATVAPHLAETLTVLAVGHAAERLSAGVLLHDCVVP